MPTIIEIEVCDHEEDCMNEKCHFKGGEKGPDFVVDLQGRSMFIQCEDYEFKEEKW